MKKYIYLIKPVLTIFLVLSFCVISVGATMVMVPEITGLQMKNFLEMKPADAQQLNVVRIFSDEQASEESKDAAIVRNPLIWVSNNDHVATVDENGLVTAVGAGYAKITVSTGNDKVSAYCVIKVNVEATGVTAAETLDLIVNLDSEQLPLDAVAEPADATDVKLIYESSDESVATVDAKGIVTGVSSGECVITTSLVSTRDPEKYNFTTETAVTVQIAPESLSLEDGSVYKDRSSSLKVITAPEKVDVGNTFTWESSNPDVVTVDENGKLHGESLGTATITATNELGQTATCTITVEPQICSYCGAEGHLKSNCAARSVANGAVGRWVIPDVDVDVAVYRGMDQDIVDRSDSAAYWHEGTGHFLADHKHQDNFSAIKSCTVGMVAYMDRGNGNRQKYVCTDVIQGHNTCAYITDAYGNDAAYLNNGGISLYTCNDCWQNITIVFFQPA